MAVSMISHLCYVDKDTENVIHIKLVPETDEEQELLKSGQNDKIEYYHYKAVSDHLGDDYSLILTLDSSGWPCQIIGQVQKSKG